MALRHLDYQEDPLIVGRAEMPIEVFLVSPELLHHDRIVLKGVAIDVTTGTTGLNAGSLG